MFSVDDFIDRSLLVSWASDYVLIIHRYVTAEHRRGLFGLEEKTMGAGLMWTEMLKGPAPSGGTFTSGVMVNALIKRSF